MKRLSATGAACVLVILLLVENGLSTRRQSVGWDEGDHIFAGYMNWKQGAYYLNPEHPPLVKLVATLPLLALELKTAPLQGRYFKNEAYFGGRELLFRNAPQYGGSYEAATLMFRIHMATLIFAVGLAWLLFAAGREMFGSLAGLAAMALYVFDPSVLSQAPFVATDTAACLGFFAVTYLFYRFSKQMNWQRAAVCGLALGLALASKHSAIVLFPILLLLAAGELGGRWWAGRRVPGREALRMALGLALTATVALTVLWAVYGFRFAMKPAGVYLPSLELEVQPLQAPIRSFLLFCQHYKLLPESYIFGLADVQNVGISCPSYIFGQIHQHGVWYYFPTLLTLKWTIGTLVLLALAIWVYASGRIRKPREIFFLALPAIVYLAIAVTGPLNLGVRHILPLFPFIFALAGAAMAYLARLRRGWAWVIGVLLLAHAVESLSVFPNYLPFGNQLWGGSSNTYRYFTDSAVDWGQQLVEVKEWTDRNKVKECAFAYYAAPYILPSDYGIPCRLLPTPDTNWAGMQIDLPPVVHGPILISLGDLNGWEYGSRERNIYRDFVDRKPDELIANGVAVYYGDPRIRP
jgi:Dolichyl-phosphate-mannose-protein mannosyltransferase